MFNQKPLNEHQRQREAIRAYERAAPERARFWWAAGAILAAPLLDLAIFTTLILTGGIWPVALFSISIFTAKTCLVLLWLVWGSLRIIWRIPFVLLSSYVTVCIFDPPSPDINEFAIPMISVLPGAAILAVPKLFGVRWIVLDQYDWANTSGRRFSLADLFCWTALAALGAAAVQWLEVPQIVIFDVREVIWSLVFFICFPALATLLAMWAALTDRATASMRIAIAFTSWMALVIAGLSIASVVAANSPAASMLFDVLVVAALAMAWLLATLSIFRHFDHRLITIQTNPPPPTAKKQSPHV